MVDLRRATGLGDLLNAFNRLMDTVLGNHGGRINLEGDDGVERNIQGGATLSTGNYSLRVNSANGTHILVPAVLDVTGTQVRALIRLEVRNGSEFRLYNADNTNPVNLYHSGTADIGKSDDSWWLVGSLGVGVTPSGLDAGDIYGLGALGIGVTPAGLAGGEILASGDIAWRSGQANQVQLQHNVTADRTLTVQDLAGGTVAVLGVTNGAALNLTLGANFSVPGTITVASGGTGTSTQTLFGGATPTWRAITPADFAAGDLYTCLHDETLAGAGTFDVQNISGAYSALDIQLQARGDTAALATSALLRFNNDSGGNYDYQNLQANNATLAGAGSVAQTSILLGTVPAASAAANLAGQVDAQVANYAGTTWNKTVNARSGNKFPAGAPAAGDLITYSPSGFWRDTSAIDRVQILAGAGSFVAGSRLLIWGRPAG